MNLDDEIDAVRQTVRRLAGRAEPRLVRKYALWHPVGQRRTPYRRFRKALGRFLRAVRLRPTPPTQPWRPALKHAGFDEQSRAFIVWAVGADKESLRQACRGFERKVDETSGWVPVLITDVSDFRFFSRLGWLVEYVPAFASHAATYRERKLRHLAWLYRGAPVLPAGAGLADDRPLEEMLLG